MKTAPVAPARIVRDDDGTPRSADYDDVYHPRSGALAQARHVFLDGDSLAARWRGRERFVVLETGFGLGNNFLATWAAWREDPGRCRQLHFISIETSPPTRSTFASLEREPGLAPLAAELAPRWPPLTCNLHRIVLDEGGVELLLAFGAVDSWLPQLVASVDAFFLDGFAPARNPAMWDARLFKAMARLAAPGATVATWSAARAVRDGLRSAGFDVDKAPGSGGKRDITRGRFAPRFAPRLSPRRGASTWPRAEDEPPGSTAPVVIVGAGLAGCALARALAERGVRSLVLERSAAIAGAGSGNAAGLFHGVVHRGDGRHARFHRAAALVAGQAVRRAIERHGVHGSAAGLLRVETTLALAEMRALIDLQGLPGDYVEALDATAASRLAGVTLASPAWHFPGAGWVDPRGLARSWLDAAGAHVELRLGCAIASLGRVGDGWRVDDADGAAIATAPIVVLCNGDGALPGSAPWPIRRQRGQLSAIATADLGSTALPRLPIAGSGYVLPPLDGAVWFGASSSWDDDDLDLRADDQRRNLERVTALLDWREPPELGRLGGRVGFRWTSDDRLPIVGAVPASVAEGMASGFVGAASPRFDQPRFVARAPGLFVCAALGSRGIASAAFGAEILAAAITGAPLPAEADLLDAIDPARFVSRRFRRDEAARQRLAAGPGQPPVGPIAGSAGA
ncbi:MAG: FAD-dependent 5-carboxymethylaminomethyl-2-thiouridine(34) oxidoreductase MnmC [Caldimonas sp.]